MFLLVIIRDTILQQRNAREIWEVVSFLFLASLLSTFLLLLLVELIAQKAVWAKLKLINRKLTISFIFWSFPQNKITSEKKSPSVCDHVFIMIIFQVVSNFQSRWVELNLLFVAALVRARGSSKTTSVCNYLHVYLLSFSWRIRHKTR
jgi:hypothetical protein